MDGKTLSVPKTDLEYGEVVSCVLGNISTPSSIVIPIQYFLLKANTSIDVIDPSNTVKTPC